jgi:hypothetical protein
VAERGRSTPGTSSGQEAGLSAPPQSPAKSTGRTYIFRPGSIGRSTDLWFVLPPVVWWIGLVIALALGREFDPKGFGPNEVLASLLGGSITLVLWAIAILRSQSEKDALRPDGRTFDHGVRHEFWRARTIAWGLLAIGIAAMGLLGFLWAGLAMAVPSTDLPFVELAVLVLTLALLAVFARYNSMTFRTDGDRLIDRLEETSRIETAARLAETERLVGTFTSQTDRLVAKIEAQSLSMSQGMAGIAVKLQNVADAIQTQARIASEARAAAERAAELQSQALQQATDREASRVAAERRAALDRIARVRPDIRVQMRGQGVLFHHLYVDVFNGGMDAVGLRVQVTTAQGTGPEFAEPGIRANTPRSFDLGDVGGFEDEEQFTVTVLVSDVDGNPYECIARLGYARERGFLGRTTAIRFEPAGWARTIMRELRPLPA